MEEFALKQMALKVYDYCGLDYRNNLPSLEMKLIKRLNELRLNLWNYMRLLETDDREWDVAVELLTINETYFYREDKQLQVFTHHILPIIINDEPEKQVNVWSAACSTGEEPYSLAMTALDANKNFKDNIRILGTDINKKVLQHANIGAYNKRSLSFRRIPETWVKQYFFDQDRELHVQDSVKEMVTFEYLNLLDTIAMNKMTNQFDVIFCRNVLIYFDEATIKKVVSHFYDSLKEGGYLFLGHAENISQLKIGFETMSKDGTFYYRKKD